MVFISVMQGEKVCSPSPARHLGLLHQMMDHVRIGSTFRHLPRFRDAEHSAAVVKFICCKTQRPGRRKCMHRQSCQTQAAWWGLAWSSYIYIQQLVSLPSHYLKPKHSGTRGPSSSIHGGLGLSEVSQAACDFANQGPYQNWSKCRPNLPGFTLSTHL